METFRSDIKVHLNYAAGSDLTVCRSAWVSSGNDDINPSEKRMRGLIHALMRDKHASPIESGFFEFYVEAPRAVRDEVVRHRSLSFSSSSLRYTEGIPEFYVPPRHRPMVKAKGFKQIQPKYDLMREQDYECYVAMLKASYRKSHQNYETLKQAGFNETEQLRWITHDGQYVRFIVRGMLRQILQFLALRTHNEDANHISYPMWEIQQMADQMEVIVEEHFPLVYEAWNEFGREI